jgi:anthranilate phosphoribosyltransferase
MWHPKRSTRIILGIIGVLAVVVGMGAWSFETEYGGDGPGEIEHLADGTEKVYDINDQEVDDEGHQLRTLVFEGTPAEVEAYLEARRNEGRNYLIPALIIGAGVVLILAALVPAFGETVKRSG